MKTAEMLGDHALYELHRRDVDAVLLRDGDDLLELRHLRRCRSCGQIGCWLPCLRNESLNSGRRLNDHGSRGSASASAMCVNDAAWKVNERTGRRAQDRGTGCT